MPTHEAHLQPFLVSYTVCADWSYVRLLKLNYQPGTTSALIKYTRIHSGKMRTARLLTLSRSIRWGGSAHPPEADHSQRQTFPWMQSPPPPHTSWRLTPDACVPFWLHLSECQNLPSLSFARKRFLSVIHWIDQIKCEPFGAFIVVSLDEYASF